MILNTCHISKRECKVLIPEARKTAVKKIIIDHMPIIPSGDKESYWTVDEAKQIAKQGAIIEHVAATYTNAPDSYSNATKFLAEFIKEVGADKCELSSDCGAIVAMHPIESMRYFILTLLKAGLSETEIEMMTKKNPARLLNLS